VIRNPPNHSTRQAALVYARMSEDPVRKALDEHGKLLMAVAGKAEGRKVIEMKEEG